VTDATSTPPPLEAEQALVTYADPDITQTMQIFGRLNPLKSALGIENLTDPELQLFAMVALHTGLDPFTKQIYAIKRGGKVTHQTGIDGYRSTAERTQSYRGSDPAEFEPCECGKDDSPPVHPLRARVTVYRSYPDGIRGQVGEALWHELKPKHVKPQGAYGYLDDMWWQMPFNQLAKCAEANGLRKAFPRVLGGVYITEEMEQANSGEPELEAGDQPTGRAAVAARAAALRAQRGEAQPEVVQAEEGQAREDPAQAPVEPPAGPPTPEPEPAPSDEAGPAPATDPAVCGSVAGDNTVEPGQVCAREAGHSGVHRNYQGTVTWPAAKV
jgi:phage recombination protein Bet